MEVCPGFLNPFGRSFESAPRFAASLVGCLSPVVGRSGGIFEPRASFLTFVSSLINFFVVLLSWIKELFLPEFLSRRGMTG